MTATATAQDSLAPAVRRDVERAVRLLVEIDGVRRIWLFGSVAKGRQPDFRSDLDIAALSAFAEWLRAPEDSDGDG